VGPRDQAQPLLTYLEGPARVELSGTTTANWVAKTANLLTDGFAGPERVGLLLPLHWQTVCLLLGGVAAGATVVVASTPDQLEGCAVAFTSAGDAEAALDAGVEDVLACSLTPFATRLSAVPAMVLDAAAEIPSYGDHFGGRPRVARIERGGQPFTAPTLPLGRTDRLLTTEPPSTEAGLGAILGALKAGAALILLRDGDADAVYAAERATATVS
jgi:uncharacterized protein (TIGR03089 family)